MFAEYENEQLMTLLCALNAFMLLPLMIYFMGSFEHYVTFID